jgi:uncharacterized repeat protein (TIGR01451 family)
VRSIESAEVASTHRFAAVCEAVLRAGARVRFQARGQSMQPNVRDGDVVEIAAAGRAGLRRGDIVLTRNGEKLLLHRAVGCDADTGAVVTRGDSGIIDDAPADALLGRVISIERGRRKFSTERPGTKLIHSARRYARRIGRAGAHRAARLRSVVPVLFLIAGVFVHAPAVRGQFTITNTATPTTVAPGGTITYTQALMATATFTPSAGNPVSTTQTFPASVTYVGYAVAGTASTHWTCAPTGSTLNCSDTSGATRYHNGNTTTITITVTASTTATNGTVIGNTVDSSPGGGSATAPNVTVVFPFSMGDSAAPTTVAPAGTITYTQVLTAVAAFTPSATNPATTSQAIPANTTYVSYVVAGTANTHWTCTLTAGTLGCSDTSGATAYAVNNTTTFTVTVTVSAGVSNGTVITDTVTAGPGSASASANVTAQMADLSMTQNVSPNPVATGGQITYTETVKNNSGVTAAGATLTQSTPTNTTFNSVTAPAGWTCGTQPAVGGTGVIICTANAAMAANSTTGNFTIVVTVNASVPVGSNIANTAVVSETGTDPNPGNNTTITTTAINGADLSMTQSASATSVAPGATITYTETVTNNGPNAAANAVLYQKTPASTTFSSITAPAGWTCPTKPAVGGTGQVICTNANVNSGVASGSFTYVVTVAAGTAAGTTIVNPADVSSDTTDPVSSNNATMTSVLVESSSQWDLSVLISAAPTPVFVSSQLSYAIQVQNLGLASAGTVTLTDTLPAAMVSPSGTLTSGSGSCGAPSGGKIVCTLTTLPATVTITGTTPTTASTLQNTASVPTTGDSVPGNNSATVVTVVQPLVCATPGNDGAPGTALSGIVNTYFAPASAGTVNAGSTSVTLKAAAAGGAQTPVAVGDLLLVIQMQDASINSTNTTSYGAGTAGNPSGSTSLGSSGLFEFVTATSAVPATGGTLNFVGTGAGGGLLNAYVQQAASATQGAATFQVIRVPQYTSATLSSGLTVLPWNGSVGGVLALDVASQLTLGGTVSLDGDGFRGGGGITLRGPNGGASTDTVTSSPAALPALGPDPPNGSGANGSKGEGIAGTPHWVAPSLSTITPGGAATALSTNQTYAEGLPNGSFGRGAPGNAGGGATDADPPANDQNDGGGGGGNGGTGGTGGFAWNSANVVGGFGGAAYPANTGAVVMGGGGGAGTSNNGAWWDPATNAGNADCGADCTGVFSSGTAGGGIVIIRAGSVTGTGTITANGLNALDEENDSGGGGGAGGSILVYANSGSLSGLTAIADGGNGGTAWPEQTPGAFPGNRHGPGGGGGGGVILGTAGISGQALGGAPGTTTLAQDAYGATAGQPGIVATQEVVTETPGSQSGAYCAGGDLAVTNSAAPNPVMPGADITYTQMVTNAGPQDAVNATLNEVVPANTTFQSIAIAGADATGWSCTTPAVGGTGNISCTNADVPSGANGTATFTVIVQVNPGTPSGTQIADTVSVASGTNDPNLTNNSATAVVLVAAANTAELSITNSGSPNPVTVHFTGGTVTYTVVVKNSGPAAASSPVVTDSFTCIPQPSGAAYNCITGVSTTPWPSGWTCGAVSGQQFTCTGPASIAANGSATFTFALAVSASTAAGTLIQDTASVSSSTSDPNPTDNSASATVVVATAGQSDLAVTKTGTPSTVESSGNNNKITYTVVAMNNGPATVTAVLTDTFSSSETLTTPNPCPSGWTYNSVSSTIFTCTASMAPNTSATATFVMTVVSGTAPGTAVTNTASLGPTASDPYTSNNTASTTSYVASPTQADVAIVKTASPQPVEPGTALTYTLQITNNGPAVAQNLCVTDPLPSQVTFVSASPATSQGNCPTPPAGTLEWSIPTLSVGGLEIITINTTTESSGTPAAATNTATVACAPSPASCPSDPNLTNNTSTVNSSITSPTAVELDSFTAELREGGGVLIQWRTREETRNLGFHVYREDATGRHQLDPSLIAGSALFLRGGLPQHHARTYEWLDRQGGANASYWLEDVDLNGTATLHGPVTPEGMSQETAAVVRPLLLTQMNAAILRPTHVNLVTMPEPAVPLASAGPKGVSLDGRTAVKISVSSEGWYRVTGAQLVAAGFSSNLNSRTLHLYAEGVEQPLLVSSKSGVLGPNDSIEFYGTGIDTPFSGTRVYWLTSGWGDGMRISSVEAAGSGTPSATSFPLTVLFQQRTTYFAALLNGENNDNFFGALVTTTPIDQVLNIAHFDANSSVPATLSVTLQGVTQGQDHRVDVDLNGVPLGEMDFSGQANSTNTFSVSAGSLQTGSNTVTLTSLDGDMDVSLVQSIELTYAHAYSADSDWLRATAQAGETIRIGGFAQPSVEVFDITDPTAIIQLNAPVTTDGASYGVTLTVDGPSGTERTLLAFAGDQISTPEALMYHAPSALQSDRQGANYIVITHPDFLQSVEPLVKLHESEGESVAVVTTDQIYDAFNYGERSPFALRAYLQFAATQWRVKPTAVLLVGDASLDPRNYLGFGDSDFVPTRMIQTAAFKTASDDWLTDFNQSGYETIPTGRLPVSTPAEAALVVSKIVNYESGAATGSWQNQAVMIADQNIDANFTAETNSAAAVLPSSLQVTKILANGQNSNLVRQQINSALNSGALLVNYAGHGSEQQWSFADLFDDSSATALTNGNQLPMYLLMDCLNGFFQDVYGTSLSTSLMLAPNGGAVAVWASSGFTDAAPQGTMDQAFLSAWAANPQLPVGSAILAAKSGITDPDVRRTWILFGDPEMRLHLAPAAPSMYPSSTRVILRRPASH